MIYRNKFHCGSRLWRKFGWAGRAVYNEVYASMRRMNNIAPRTKSFTKSLIMDTDWEVIVHNAATTAAWAADKAVLRLAA